MKQQLKICSKCPFYYHIVKGIFFRKKGSFCLKDKRFYDHRPKGLRWYVTTDKNGGVGFEDRDFEKVEVGEHCLFYTEYCMFEWNKKSENEKKNIFLQKVSALCRMAKRRWSDRMRLRKRHD